MTQNLNLKALRCPAAMIYVRRAIQNAIDTNFKGIVVVSTIEPSMKRDIALFLNSCDANINISEENKVALTDCLQKEWVESGEATTCELENIDSIQEFALTFN